MTVSTFAFLPISHVLKQTDPDFTTEEKDMLSPLLQLSMQSGYEQLKNADVEINDKIIHILEASRVEKDTYVVDTARSRGQEFRRSAELVTETVRTRPFL